MLSLPGWMITIVTNFAPAICKASTWHKIEVLVAGAILARGKRTVSAVLRVMGMSQERNYAKYHQVLSRAVWSGLEVSAILLRVMVKTFDTGGTLVFGIDETLERAVVEDHRRAVRCRLKIALDAIAAIDRRDKGRPGVLDHAGTAVVQSAMRDRPDELSAVELRPHDVRLQMP